MNIKSVRIQNFRKLKSCEIEFSNEETILVGANNSGKTSAMEAMIIFLKTKKFKTQDFTLHNWLKINKISQKWLEEDISEEDIELSLKKLSELLPTLDLWINVDEKELHYVNHIIPTLDWEGGSIGIRLKFEPKDINKLIEDFSVKFNKSSSLSGEKTGLKIWPKHLWDFCERELNTYFAINAYLLDPNEEEENKLPIEGNPLEGLIKVNIINAQRGFSDANAEDEKTGLKSLSSQLRSYYDKHLDPNIEPTEKDINALKEIDKAQEVFSTNLKAWFSKPIEELEKFNYPGLYNPKIEISSQSKPTDGLQHESAVTYYLDEDLSLPEKYNGLGYQNLISITFKLIRFRDEWLNIGKSSGDSDIIEPIHLVLIEEPEAHLHAQVQQVFIKKAYDVLRNNSILKNNESLNTQLVISTHSSYIAYQKFLNLRYFKRENNLSEVHSKVINMSKTFGVGENKDEETEKFAKRYLSTTHNDVFFADAVILVEGPAERMLIPHFIKSKFKLLDKCYITILEIGGSHAHRLKPLIEKLGIICLIITDIDSKEEEEGRKKCQPKLGKNLKTSNDTLKSWYPKKVNLDDLLSLSKEDKEDTEKPIRVAYQYGINTDDENNTKIYPYTFEDALVFENKECLKKLEKTKGLLKKMIDAVKSSENDTDLANKLYEIITSSNANKAEFALDIMYEIDPEELTIPTYIHEGLKWVQTKLENNKEGLNYDRV